MPPVSKKLLFFRPKFAARILNLTKIAERGGG